MLVFLVLSVLSIPTAPTASAQIGSQGRITGFVRDQNSAVLSGSTIVVTDSGTGQKRTVQTDSAGYYVVANIPPGLYEVVVEQQGFKKFVQNVKLDAASSLSVDATLEIGDVGETVTVTASGNQVQTTTAQVGRLLEGEQVQRLSLNGRNPILLGLLKAGVVSANNTSGFNYTPTTAGLSVNGSRADETSILLDGVQQVRTRSAGSTTGVVGVDTVQEVQILTSNYAPELGRANGGQFLFVTKPGTQEFHGTLSYFLRNDKFDANTWSRNRTPVTSGLDVSSKPQALRFNQPGYSIGGPIYIPGKFNTAKDKLFFFFAQEYTRFRREDTRTATVPGLALRAGDLRELGAGADLAFGTTDDPVKD
ncbi:MAG: carboxypeptidase regulatory-like domain-containing protein, partial [Pyrinomonadaceae bacterium]